MPTTPHSLISSLTGAISLLGSLLARPAIRFAAYAILALATTWPMLNEAANLNSYRDSHPLVQYEESARRTVLEFGQVPLWDPYYCGGLDGLGTPQSKWASPTFLLSLVFGTLRAEPLMVFLFMLLGLEGAFRYARSRGATYLGAALAAPMFALSGFFAVSPALGWVHFMGFELVPWIAWGLRRGMRGNRMGVAVSAGGLALMVGFGGTYPAPMTALFCAFEVIEALWARRQDRKRLAFAASMAGLVAIFALGLAALRLWPVVQTLTMAPRIIGGAPQTIPEKIMAGLLGRIKPDEQGDFPIAGNYLVGLLSGAAVAAGVARRRTMAITTAGFLALWLASGYAAKVSLFAALKGLPVYSTLRYPERFLVLFALAASALAALGITRLQSLARARGDSKKAQRFRLLGALALTASVTLLLGNVGPLVLNHHAALGGRPMVAPPRAVQQDFHQARGTRWALAYYGPMSRGVLSCYDAYPVPQSPLLRGDLKEEEYLAEPDAGSLARTYWSPNKIELDVDVKRDTRVLVNQNWHPGWRASVGNVASALGMLAIDVPAGKHHLVLRFLPRAAVGGAMISLAALGALIWFVRRGRSEPSPKPHNGGGGGGGGGGKAPSNLLADLPIQEIGVALAAIAVMFGLAFVVVKEPPLPPLDLKTSSGEPLIVDALPPDATPLGVKFGAGMTLEGARISAKQVAPEGSLTIDLFWRIDDTVDKHLGIFVHLVPNEGEDIRADHVLLSELVEPEKAPRNVIFRDVVPISIPHDVGTKTYQVFAGVWSVRGDAKRIPVIDPGKGKVDKNRVELEGFSTAAVPGAR